MTKKLQKTTRANGEKISARPKLLKRQRSSSVPESKVIAGLREASFKNYTREELARINHCVAKVRTHHNGLQKSEWKELLAAGRTYWTDMIYRARGANIVPSKKRYYWRKVAQDFSRVAKRLESSSRLYGPDWRRIGIAWLPEKLVNNICSRILPPEFDPKMFVWGLELPLRIGDVLDLVVELQEQASGLTQAGIHIVGESERHVIFDQGSERLDPRVVYFTSVLQLWGKVGGALKLPTRNWNTGKLDSDLVRFFRAVVDPVMRQYAPSTESIPDIVKRQKDKYKKEPWLDPSKRSR